MRYQITVEFDDDESDPIFNGVSEFANEVRRILINEGFVDVEVNNQKAL